jgi:predicted RecB family nuclease
MEKRVFAMKCTLASSGKNFHFESGYIAYGQSLTKTKITLEPYEEESRQAISQLKQMLANDEPPRFYRTNQCDMCEFQTHCLPVLTKNDDLSLLGGMTPKQVMKQNSRGIFSVLQFSYTFTARKRSSSTKKLSRCEWTLKAFALREHQTCLLNIPEFPKVETELFVDFEGLPDEQYVYLIGVLMRQGVREKRFSFWANSVHDEERIFTQLFDLLDPLENFRFYHYGRYEIQQLQRFNKKMEHAYDTMLQKISENAINILSVFIADVYPPTYTNGLKEIATFLGFTWSHTDASGIQSIVWRKKWELTQGYELKNWLLQYNREDCEALHCVKEWIEQIPQDLAQQEAGDIFKIEPRDEKNIRKFGKVNFQNDDLEHINAYAYFDYQRSKVYLRTNTTIKKAMKRASNEKRVLNPVNQIIPIVPSQCPYCGHTQYCCIDKLSNIVTDLKFIKNGMKKWVVEYQSREYHCHHCRRNFIPEEYRKRRRKGFGPNLTAWVMHYHVSYRTSLTSIEKMLEEIFHFPIATNYTYQLKAELLRKYSKTFTEIYDRIVSGALIHADETTVKLKGHVSAYIWVFASMDTVYYLFRPNREADFLSTFLKGFLGVLVTDFYPGYDALPCPQQKCLVHLIRDLNTDLLHHQLDSEYKDLVGQFGKLLRKIVETIDTYGLKKRHLHKHQHDVEMFYAKLSRASYTSELAQKYQRRFEKNTGKLFTFLDYDGVPWNNNNAEHAIKAFARYRTINDGAFTEKSLKEYLSLLSIQQTCVYRELSFLEFLKSEEVSLDKYSQNILK